MAESNKQPSYEYLSDQKYQLITKIDALATLAIQENLTMGEALQKHGEDILNALFILAFSRELESKTPQDILALNKLERLSHGWPIIPD